MRTITDQYLGGTLYHFWPHEPRARALNILNSICERGFLLSRGSGELVDQFQVYGDGGGVEPIYVAQNARVCFTDIPEDKLHLHCGTYGRFAVGFARQTIVEWGGCPVWYLPNHVVPDSLQGQSGEIIRGTSRAVRALVMFQQLLGTDELRRADIQFRRGPQQVPVPLDAVAAEVAFAREGVLRIVAFLKQMSSVHQDDHRYLFEREWRIVRGVSFGDPEALYRSLTTEEKAELVALNPKWSEPLRSQDDKLAEGGPIIDTFRFFNGIPGRDRVSTKIERILVPDHETGSEVRAFIKTRQELFCDGGPEVSVLEDDESDQ